MATIVVYDASGSAIQLTGNDGLIRTLASARAAIINALARQTTFAFSYSRNVLALSSLSLYGRRPPMCGSELRCASPSPRPNRRRSVFRFR